MKMNYIFQRLQEQEDAHEVSVRESEGRDTSKVQQEIADIIRELNVEEDKKPNQGT